MKLVFLRRHERLVVVRENPLGETHVFKAANFTDSRSKGPWPKGIYPAQTYYIDVDGPKGHPGGSLGPWFLEFVNVPGRTEMGLHAGRVGKKDGRGRQGHRYCTYGCIRTEEDAMFYIADTWEYDPVTEIWVT